MAELPVLTDLKAVLLADTPLMDVRAPIEFTEGAIPHATNLPLMNDQERAAVGTCYKRKGQQAAIQLGYELVSGQVKSERVEQWVNFVRNHPQGALYCFRGGLRSRITQQWLFEASGIECPRIHGGYKALRRFLLESLEQCASTQRFLVLTGRTGAGKTQVLKSLPNALDLEGLAHHRGSAFGHYPQAQPTQINFENQLAVQLLKQQQYLSTIVEDECRTIGSIHSPKVLFDQLVLAPLIVLEVPDTERLERTYQEYVVEQLAAFQAHCVPDTSLGFELFKQYLLGSVQKIAKRLGGVRFSQVLNLMNQALSHQEHTGELEQHLAWVKVLLFEYYDPMYDYQVSRKHERVQFSGSQIEVLEYLRSLHPA